MRTWNSALFVVAMLVGGPTSASSDLSKAHPAAFCPDCWKFLTNPGDLDGAGRCSISGKKPVEVEAVTVSWYWCLPHQAWHRRPCGQDFSRPLSSTALLVPAGSESVSVRPYCPGDRKISDVGHEGTRCPVCSKPFVGAATVERRWYWCGTQKTWLTQPCSGNRNLLQCCTPRKGPVLAYSWEVPYLSEVSFSAARGDMPVQAEWLAVHLDDPHLIVVHVGFDANDPALSLRPTYFDGHIPGARPVAWQEITRTRNGIPNEMPSVEQLVPMVRSLGINREDRIILYDTGSGLEAARAYVTLDYLGLGGNAALLDGQWARWKGLNFPDSRMPEEVEPSNFVPRLRPEILVPVETMKDLAWLSRQEGSNVTILDARPPEEYTGQKPGKGIPRGGHIAGAKNLCWTELLEAAEEPLFRSEPELRGMFEAKGARPGQMVVVYCRTGVQASLLYFAAKSLGYETRLYDGSYFEWVREQELPAQDRWALR
jgi:thiosulfate/3-mercaptopyruvate sulfurtransferase